MSLKFWDRAKREQSKWELRRAHAAVTTEHARLMDTCDWYVDRLNEEAARANAAEARAEELETRVVQAETVVVCLDGQLAEERRKVAALEQIAGPYRDSADEPSPIYTEVTQDIPLSDGEATINLPVMSLVALGAQS